MREIEFHGLTKKFTRLSVALTGAVILERQGFTDVLPDDIDRILINLSAAASIVSLYLSRERFSRAMEERNLMVDMLFDNNPEFYGSLVTVAINLLTTLTNLTYIASTIV